MNRFKFFVLFVSFFLVGCGSSTTETVTGAYPTATPIFLLPQGAIEGWDLGVQAAPTDPELLEELLNGKRFVEHIDSRHIGCESMRSPSRDRYSWNTLQSLFQEAMFGGLQTIEFFVNREGRFLAYMIDKSGVEWLLYFGGSLVERSDTAYRITGKQIQADFQPIKANDQLETMELFQAALRCYDGHIKDHLAAPAPAPAPAPVPTNTTLIVIGVVLAFLILFLTLGWKFSSRGGGLQAA